MSSVVFFDIETGGLSVAHPIIQLAAIAVDLGTGTELETFERKIAFRILDAEPVALQINHFDAATWDRDARPEKEVVADFKAFLENHLTVSMRSGRTGRPYQVARVGGHNIIGFDLERVSRMFARHKAFLPIQFSGALDTLQGAAWYFEAMPSASRPLDFKLQTLASWFGITVETAHEALSDVRTSIALARALLQLSGSATDNDKEIE